MKKSFQLLFLGLAFALSLAACKTLPPNTLAFHDASRWTNHIATFKAIDATNFPPQNCILFVGSSSIVRWKTLQEDFPGLPVVNRGFGGSQMADAVKYADEIILPYKPRQVVIYSGTNDINAGKDPELVYGDLVALITHIRRSLPGARISVISVAPNPARWAQLEKIKTYNRLAEAYCARHNMDFINVFPLMLGPDGQPLPDIFVADRLHMNPQGYEIWKEAVRPYLARN
jgi:lysophospholipase L1-like esterase